MTSIECDEGAMAQKRQKGRVGEVTYLETKFKARNPSIRKTARSTENSLGVVKERTAYARLYSKEN
ncbi:hypothetical protein IFM47457_10418 [Aspergillus lentulus]|nr:hypothetical protein IFM47457_10418 [Aspergillus lentulus]